MIPEKADFPKHIVSMATTDSRKKGKLFLIVGPSGVGKTTLVRCLLQNHPSLSYVPYVSTRPMRSDDVQGLPGLFVSNAEFNAMREQDDLIDWTTFVGHHYGVQKTALLEAIRAGKNVLTENVLYTWPELKNKNPEIASALHAIFLLPANLDFLRTRVTRRSYLPPDIIDFRMQSASLEIQAAPSADLIVNVEEESKDVVYQTVERYMLSELEKN